MPKSGLRNGVTQSAEDYLKTIYKLQSSGARVTTNDLAKALKVAPASVTNMAKKLAESGLLRHTKHRGVALTPSGEKIALEMIRHHRLLELYLLEAMGYSWDRVHDEAEKLEHHISEEFEERIDQLLGHRKRDPHGDPIPDRNGAIEAREESLMAELNVGQSAVVSRVSDEDPAVLRYLKQLGLVLDTRIVLTKKAPFNGPLELRIGRSRQTVGHELARTIHVADIE